MTPALERECLFCGNQLPEKETYCDECGMDVEKNRED